MSKPIHVQIRQAIRDMRIQDLAIVWLNVTDILPGIELKASLTPDHKDLIDKFSQLDTRFYYMMQIELGRTLFRGMQRTLRTALRNAIRGN